MLFSFIKNQNTCSLMYVPLPCSFIIMSMMLQEVKKNLDWSSNHQGSSRPKMSSVGKKREDGWCWVYGGFIKTKEKEKARTVNKKKVGTIFPRPLNLFPPVSCFWRLDGRSLSSRWETGGAGDVFLVPDGPVLVFGPERSVAFASLLMLEALRSTSVNF